MLTKILGHSSHGVRAARCCCAMCKVMVDFIFFFGGELLGF